MKMSQDQLVILLTDMQKSVAAGDSFEGSVYYSCVEEGLAPGEYEVEGSYRIGNSEGQGGVRIINEINTAVVPEPVSEFTVDWWLSFECVNGKGCSQLSPDRSGVVLDMRLSLTLEESAQEPVKPLCPLCQAPMHFRGRWRASPTGHGSSGDKDRVG